MFFFFSLLIGQIGFAVILILFFYYFATILILGAQINAYFFEHIPPLPSTLGTYLSEMNREQRENNIQDSLHNETDEQHLTSTDSDRKKSKTGWMSRLWPFKKRQSVKPQLEENNNV